MPNWLLHLLIKLTTPKWDIPDREPMNNDKELEEFLTEHGILPLVVKVCPNYCGCISTETSMGLIWGYCTSDCTYITKK